MFNEFFSKEKALIDGRCATVVSLPFPYSLTDTLECGQCFRHELIWDEGEYKEYIIPIKQALITVGQRRAGELIFFDADDETFEEIIRPYFTLDTDYAKIKNDIISRTDSSWLREAASFAEGIAILAQDEWETLFSFIVSQNNNIPRIRKIIREICAAYGVNISLQNHLAKCPANKINCTPCEEKCSECGICYSFPSAADIAAAPEKMLKSRPGFRYKYLLCAAERTASGETNLKAIKKLGSYDATVSELKKIKGVGDKVASCCALFGFGNLEAFPIDVWMKRAIDTYFDGNLDPASLGAYAGVAQQYIFHYIRNKDKKEATV